MNKYACIMRALKRVNAGRTGFRHRKKERTNHEKGNGIVDRFDVGCRFGGVLGAKHKHGFGCPLGRSTKHKHRGERFRRF